MSGQERAVRQNFHATLFLRPIATYNTVGALKRCPSVELRTSGLSADKNFISFETGMSKEHSHNHKDVFDGRRSSETFPRALILILAPEHVADNTTPSNQSSGALHNIVHNADSSTVTVCSGLLRAFAYLFAYLFACCPIASHNSC